MRFEPLPLEGCFVIDPEPIADERGYFARFFEAETFARRGLESRWAYIAASYNRRAGTLRGLHFQDPPFEEIKLVRCTAGGIHDVVLDLRRGSRTFGRWEAVELSAENRRLLYVAAGLAHGFQTLRDGCEVTYHISAPYRPEAGRGVRWNDPRFGIRWPLPVGAISERDRSYADFREV